MEYQKLDWKVYPFRIIIIILYSLMAISSGMLWVTFFPITDKLENVKIINFLAFSEFSKI